jgi:hypothetical protein
MSKFIADVTINGNTAHHNGNFGKTQIDLLGIDAATLGGSAKTSFVDVTTNQTVAGTKTFSSAVVLSTAGTTTSHAVRADRSVSTGDGLSGGGNLTANRTLTVDATVARQTAANGALNLPTGNTSQRPTASTGMLRFNSETGSFEGYNGTSWDGVGGGGGAVTSVAGRTGDVTLAVADVANAVANSRSISTNNGLTGGGNLTADRTLGLTGQALALHNLATNGVIARTGAGTVAARTITAGTGITVSNGDGAAGNPTVTNSAPHVATNLTATGGTTAGPVINSSTGTGVTIPSASGTASGVVTTGAQTFAGVKTFSSTITGSISGNAGTVTNGVYTSGDQTIGGTKTFSSTITGSISGNAGTVTNGVYTSGDQTIAGAKTFSGEIIANGQVRLPPTTLATTGTVNIDFAGASYRTQAELTGAVTYTASNYAAGRSVTIRVTNGATLRTLTFPASWKFVGAKPADIAASKVGILTVTSFGTTEADCVAAWGVES